MRIKQVIFFKTYNTGNYENIRVELVADVDEDEDVHDVLDELKRKSDAWRRSLEV